MANVTSTGITISSSAAISALSNGQKIMIAAARRAFEPAAPDPDLWSSERMGPGNKQWDVLTYARLADAVALTEGVDLSTVQQLAANYVSVNPSEHGTIVTLSKRAIRRQPESLEDQAGFFEGVSLRARMAKDVIALYDGYSKSVGGAGTTLDITYLRGTTAYLMTDNDTEYGPAPMPYKYAAHPENISDIVLDITDTAPRGGSDLSDEMVQRWWRGSDRAYGIGMFTSNYITRDSSDDVKGALGAAEAQVLVMEGEDDEPTEQDISHRLIEFGLFKSWGESEVADPYAAEMLFDAAATV